MIVKTRSCNCELYDKMRSLIPSNIECLRFDNYREWEDASRFIHDAIDYTDDILVLVDDDCFIYDWSVVEDLVQSVQDGYYAFAGMPDGGSISHRTNSWVVANPFFLVVNCPLIKGMKSKFTRETIDSFLYDGSMKKYIPPFINDNYRNLSDEIFNGIFYFMAHIGVPYYLESKLLDDNISTELMFNGKPFLIHTWYSRNYLYDDEVKKRIDSYFELAKSKVK